MNANDKQHRAILQSVAERAMLERGLLPDFSAEALAELAKIQAPAEMNREAVRDLGDCASSINGGTFLDPPACCA
jgi:hypothetical protein